MLGLLMVLVSSAGAVTLTGSSEYAVPGDGFNLTCDVPEEAIFVAFYRRSGETTTVQEGSIQVSGGSQCYNVQPFLPAMCTPGVCSCQHSTVGYATSFQWVIRPQAGDHSSLWFCKRRNPSLPDNDAMDSPDYTLKVANGPGTSIALSPPDPTYTNSEGNTLPPITCTADCRPTCSFVWTKPDTTNFPASPVLSLGQLDRSEHGTYTCTAQNGVGDAVNISTSVNVQYPPKILSLTYTSGDVDVSENDNKSLICTVESYPASTIQWYYKGNNTQLLSTPDTLESTYILPRAGCLDTGVYTCSVSNSEASTPVTMDIPVNMLCKPRQNFREHVRLQYGLGLLENLAIPVSFISNPEPSYKWIFQNSSLAIEDLFDGKDNFAIHNNYYENSLSAMSIAVRRGLHERWFGFYIVTATNNQGRSTLNFTVEAKGADAEPVSGGSGPSSSSVGLFIGSGVFLLVGVLLFIWSYLMRRGVNVCCKRNDKESSDVPLDRLPQSYYNVNIAPQGPVPIDSSNYEEMQPRDPPSVYQDLSPIR